MFSLNIRRAIFISFTLSSLIACTGQSSDSNQTDSMNSEMNDDTVSMGSEMPSNTNNSGLGTVTLNWLPPTENDDYSPLTDLSGYKIYYGTSQDTLDTVVTIDNPGLATFVIDNLPANNTTYYFSITAFNSTEIEGNLSNIVSKTLM